MRILLTGAAGRVGGAIAAALRAGHDVVGVDVRPGRFVDLQWDIGDAAAPLARRLGAVDAIVHTAALHAPHVGRRPDAAFGRTNVEGTARLLDLALARGAARFVYTSSTSVYGHALEPRGGGAAWIDEDTVPEPRDIYDETKLAAERLVRAAARSGGPCAAILRMSRCFPEERGQMARYRLYRGVDLRDVVRAHLLALAGARAAPQTYVISAATPFRREDCAALLTDAGAVIRARAPEVARAFLRRGEPLPQSIDRVYCAARAAEALNFSPVFGPGQVLAGDCDPSPVETAPPRRSMGKNNRLTTCFAGNLTQV